MAYVPGTLETDPKKQNASLRSLNDGLTTAQGDITTNAANIATNTANISSNTASIATNSAAISTNTTDITNLKTPGYGLTYSGALIVGLSKITASLGADVSLNNVSNYFDGPSVAQGTTGTWFASGQVTVVDSAGSHDINCKLWDGTTIISSARASTIAAGDFTVVSLSGFITSPAGNIRISCNEPGATTGKISFNASGNSKDSTITAVRIA